MARPNESAPSRESRTLADLPASSRVSPAFLQWAAERETVRPGEDGTLPPIDRGGWGLRSLVWGGPMQTGEASVRARGERTDRRDGRVVDDDVRHGEARVVGGEPSTTGPEGFKERPPRERKRRWFRKLLGDDGQKRRLAKEIGN